MSLERVIVNGLFEDPTDKRDYSRTSYGISLLECAIPMMAPAPDIDWTVYSTEIKNQGVDSSCVGFATASALEALYKKNTGKEIDFSEEMIYNIAREYDVFPGVDHEGTTIRSALKVSNKFGICEEKFYPYDQHIKTVPINGYLKNASMYKVSRYYNLMIDERHIISEIKKALGKSPVIAGFYVSDKFSYVESHGFVFPQMLEKKDYGHAMTIVDYDNKLKRFKVRNSWGTGWGDNGYCYIHEDLAKKAIISAWGFEF